MAEKQLNVGPLINAAMLQGQALAATRMAVAVEVLKAAVTAKAICDGQTELDDDGHLERLINRCVRIADAFMHRLQKGN